MVVPYKHEPFTDYTIEENKQAMLDALKKVEADFGKEYPLIIGGERITTEEKLVSVNPANKEEIIGYVSKSNKDLAEKAMKVADETFEWWRKTDPSVRADILFRAAAIVRRRKHEFSA
ncbi:aldehyde dehydrogenase family protein, partial [Virgibacillus sp. W0430]|uniref:aldehyde dehydrogenase family protein n=1 Tax=Virgibacillus sp. W0430 TaxID=3391580 RepID=UPI003F477E00